MPKLIIENTFDNAPVSLIYSVIKFKLVNNTINKTKTMVSLKLCSKNDLSRNTLALMVLMLLSFQCNQLSKEQNVIATAKTRQIAITMNSIINITIVLCKIYIVKQLKYCSIQAMRPIPIYIS